MRKSGDEATELAGIQLSDAEIQTLSRILMKRQAALSLRVAAVFVIVLVAIPLLNLYAPSQMSTPVGAFSLTWLIVGILFFPLTWLLSTYFVSQSEKIESETSDASALLGERGAK